MTELPCDAPPLRRAGRESTRRSRRRAALRQGPCQHGRRPCSKITKRGVSVIQRIFLLSFLGIVALLSLLRLAESAPRLRACCTVKRAALTDQTAAASGVRYARCDRRRALAAHPTTPHHEYRRAPVARRAPQRRRPVLRCRQPAGGAERTARRPHSSATGGR